MTISRNVCSSCSAKRALRSMAASSRPSTRGIGTSPRPRCSAVWRRLTRELPVISLSSTAPIVRGKRYRKLRSPGSTRRLQRCVSPLWVNRVALTARRDLLLFSDQRTSPTGCVRSEKCQQETRLIGALHTPFKINSWNRWRASPRTIETPEFVEPRRYLDLRRATDTPWRTDEVSVPLTGLGKKRGGRAASSSILALSNAEAEMRSWSQEIGLVCATLGGIQSRPGARSS